MSYEIGGNWQRELDRYLTENPRDDEEPVRICANCKEGIYEGETYYKVDGKAYCADCIDDFREIAELEDEE